MRSQVLAVARLSSSLYYHYASISSSETEESDECFNLGSIEALFSCSGQVGPHAPHLEISQDSGESEELEVLFTFI